MAASTPTVHDLALVHEELQGTDADGADLDAFLGFAPGPVEMFWASPATPQQRAEEALGRLSRPEALLAAQLQMRSAFYAPGDFERSFCAPPPASADKECAVEVEHDFLSLFDDGEEPAAAENDAADEEFVFALYREDDDVLPDYHPRRRPRARAAVHGPRAAAVAAAAAAAAGADPGSANSPRASPHHARPATPRVKETVPRGQRRGAAKDVASRRAGGPPGAAKGRSGRAGAGAGAGTSTGAAAAPVRHNPQAEAELRRRVETVERHVRAMQAQQQQEQQEETQKQKQKQKMRQKQQPRARQPPPARPRAEAKSPRGGAQPLAGAAAKGTKRRREKEPSHATAKRAEPPRGRWSGKEMLSAAEVQAILRRQQQQQQQQQLQLPHKQQRALPGMAVPPRDLWALQREAGAAARKDGRLHAMQMVPPLSPSQAAGVAQQQLSPAMRPASQAQAQAQAQAQQMLRYHQQMQEARQKQQLLLLQQQQQQRMQQNRPLR